MKRLTRDEIFNCQTASAKVDDNARAIAQRQLDADMKAVREGLESEGLREKVAQAIYECDYSEGYWTEHMEEGSKVAWRATAAKALALIKEELL